MLFSSLVFLWIFLPITLVLYLLVMHFGKENKIGNVILLIASLIFYAWGEPVYIFLLLVSAFINYIFGLLIGKEKYRKKFFLVIAVATNISILGFFKYFNFFASYANQICGRDMVTLSHFALPLGISFYTFQAMSYVIDVYRKEVNAQKNFCSLLLYICFFPQLIAGPIVKYKDIDRQLLYRKNSIEKRAYGVKRFIYGLGKKVLISNILGRYVDMVLYFYPEQLSTGLTWFVMIMYTFQIYYDFSGYSDMAIGLGYMFGFEFKENFNYPYISCSIREFWRRWHISLSTWFKEYVYIPLGGNRKGHIRTYINLLIVFLLTGFWHGASMTFIFWGLFHGFFIILERMGFEHLLEKNRFRFLNHLYTWIIFVCGWVFFRMDGLRNGLKILKNMFVYRKAEYNLFSCFNMEVILILVIAFLFCGVIQSCIPKLKVILFDKEKIYPLEMVFLFIVFFLCIVSLASNTYNPFIYFRF